MTQTTRVRLHALARRLAVALLGCVRDPAPDVLEHVRLEGTRLALRTIRHIVANRLAVVVGQSELLADDPRLPPELHAQANRIVDSAMSAAETLQRLDERLVQVHVDSSVAGPPVVDVDRSTSRS
jgi:hypothetical protein